MATEGVLATLTCIARVSSDEMAGSGWQGSSAVPP